MRVLILLRIFYSPPLPMGGAERQALKLARELSGNGIAVKIVTGKWNWGQPSHEVIEGIHVDRLFTAWDMFHIKGIRIFGFYIYLLSLYIYLLLHRKEYEIIHCHSAMIDSAVGVLVGHQAKKPSVIRPMASGPYGDYERLQHERIVWGQDWFIRKLSIADAVVALNPQVADEMKALGIAKEKIVFIPNGVEAEISNGEREYALHKPVRIAFIGRLHAQKGIDTLFKALSILKKENSSLHWRVQLAGTGPLEQELREMTSQLGISQEIEFLGNLEHVGPFLNESDCFVLPSLAEGMSNALLEAMASGLPCIATDIPGNNDIINDHVNGLLVPIGDEYSLTQALITLVNDEGLRRKLGEEARKTVEGHYTLGKVSQKYINLYHELLKNQTSV